MTLLERLKIETRPDHDRIETAVDIERRTGSLSDYRSLLVRFYGFHSAWEPAAGAVIADEAFFAPRRKAGLLGRDLAALGLSSDEIAQAPRYDSVMRLSSPAAALGSMYVIEGSTLGGAVIAHGVERRLGLTAETGCAYFRSYGRETAFMWKSFRTRLLAVSSPDADEVIVEAAKRTFAVMHDWLSEAR